MHCWNQSSFKGLSCFFFSAINRRRQNTILVKVPAPEESQEDQESGSEASDSVSNSGQPGSGQNGQNVTLITLNSEGMDGFTIAVGMETEDWRVSSLFLLMRASVFVINKFFTLSLKQSFDVWWLTSSWFVFSLQT